MRGESQILSLSGSCLVGGNGRHHRENAMCSVMLTSDKGKTSGNTSVNALIAAGAVDLRKSYLIYGMSSSIINL
jgi:purine nucleoside permease